MSEISPFGIKNEGYIATFIHDGEDLMIGVVDIKTEEIVPALTFQVKQKYSTVKDFVENIPLIFDSKYKAVIINLFLYKTDEYANNIEFCKAIQEKLNVNKIPHYFVPSHLDALTTTLYGANIRSSIGEKLGVILVVVDGFGIMCYKYTSRGYKLVRKEFIPMGQEGDDEDVGRMREKITAVEGGECTKIVVKASTPSDRELMKYVIEEVLPPSLADKLVIPDKEKNKDFNALKNVIDMGKWILDKTFSQFVFLPQTIRYYMVLVKLNDVVRELIVIKPDVPLPTEKIQQFTKGRAKFLLAYMNPYPYDDNTRIIFNEIELPPQSHMYKFILTIDENNMPNCDVQPILLQEIAALPHYLDHCSLPSKIPLICFCSNFSVICAYDNEAGYDFLESWNGVFGEELLISFAEEKPKFCQKALDDYRKNPASVISDLFQILSIPPGNDPSESIAFKFSITQNDDNPILCEFDNFDGTRKAATPVFLMAMLLKEHIKAIKTETGEKPEKLAFTWLSNFCNHGDKRVKRGLEDACKLLKIQCMFVKLQ